MHRQNKFKSRIDMKYKFYDLLTKEKEVMVPLIVNSKVVVLPYSHIGDSPARGGVDLVYGEDTHSDQVGVEDIV